MNTDTHTSGSTVTSHISLKNGIRIQCNTENFVPIVVPGLSTSSSSSFPSSTSMTPSRQEIDHPKSSSRSSTSPSMTSSTVSSERVDRQERGDPCGWPSQPKIQNQIKKEHVKREAHWAAWGTLSPWSKETETLLSAREVREQRERHVDQAPHSGVEYSQRQRQSSFQPSEPDQTWWCGFPEGSWWQWSQRPPRATWRGWERGAGWGESCWLAVVLAGQKILKLKEKHKTAFFSPSENWCLPAKSKNQKNVNHDQKLGDPCHSDIPEWLQEFRENLVDDRVPEHRDLHASSSHELSLEPTPTRSVDLGKHSVFTHFLKDRNCEICQRTKITRAPCRRRVGRVASRAESFGDLITADHQVLSENCESRNNHRYAVVVQDLATKWIQLYPCKTNFSGNTSSWSQIGSLKSLTLTTIP